MGLSRSTYTIWVGKPGRRLLRRSRCGFEDNIKTNLKKYNVRLWATFIWLRIETGGGVL
jgi:hypothetical protein